MMISSTAHLSINLTKPQLKKNFSKILASHFLFLTFFLSVVAPGANAQQMRISGPAGPPQVTTHPSARSICAGTNTTFTVAATFANSYQWMFDDQSGSGYINVPNTAPYSGVTSATLTITGATVGMNAYQYKVVVTGSVSPAATSNPATLTVGQAGHWLGTDGSDWENPANWACGKVPDATTNVVIGPTSISPEINVSDALCNNLTIEAGGALSVGNGLLTIMGNVTVANTGNFDRSLGPVLFAGDGQVIPAGDYFEIDISGGGTATLGGNVNVETLLALQGGFIKLGDYDLTIGAARGEIIEANPTSFVITDGKGQLKIEGVGSTGTKTGTITFPVGISALSYTPVSILNTATTDVFGVRVIDGVYASYDEDGDPTTKLTTSIVDRTWFVTEGAVGNSNATLTFNWSLDNEKGGFSREACFGSHYTDGKWVSGAAAAADENDYYSISLSGVTTFSPFGVGSAGSVLPLKLLSFAASLNKESVALKWETSQEINTAGFEVEMSKNATDFKKIGYLESRNTNSQVASKYYYYTAIPSGQQTSYYRLKLLDQDGSFSYSRIIKLQHSEMTEEYQVYPNPVQQEYLSVKSTVAKTGPVEVLVFDTRGGVRYKSRIDSNPLNIDPILIPMKNLEHSAIYIVQVTETSTGINQRFKIYRK